MAAEGARVVQVDRAPFADKALAGGRPDGEGRRLVAGPVGEDPRDPVAAPRPTRSAPSMDALLRGWWRLLAAIGAVEQVAGVALLALIVVTITIQVFTRYALRPPDRLGRGARHLRVHLERVRRRGARHEGAAPHPHRDLRRAPRAAAAARSRALRSGRSSRSRRWSWRTRRSRSWAIEARSRTMALPIELDAHWFYSVPLCASLVSMTLHRLLSGHRRARESARPAGRWKRSWRSPGAARRRKPRCDVRPAHVRRDVRADRARGAGGVRADPGVALLSRLRLAAAAVDRRAADGAGHRQLPAARDPALRAGRPPAQRRRHRGAHLRVRARRWSATSAAGSRT